MQPPAYGRGQRLLLSIRAIGTQRVNVAVSVEAEQPRVGADPLVRADMDGLNVALSDAHFLRHAVDPPLVLAANGAVKDDPVAFLVADALVLREFGILLI